MAWNEPGGSGDKDPWGGRNNDQGPPDLDEAFRKLQQKMGGLFGGGPRDPASGGGGSGFGGAVLLVVVAAIVWFLSGWYIVEEGRRGVVLQFGAYHDITMPGPHWYPRFVQSVEIVDIENIRSIEMGMRTEDALMLTQDENIIDIKYGVQYKISDPREYLFNVRDPDQTLQEAVESAVREVVGKRRMDPVITGGRTEVAAATQALAQEILDRYQTGLLITSVNMQDAQAPQPVQDAFADAVRAREDKERKKNEAEAYANDVLPKARGRAARMVAEATAYKEQVVAAAEGEAARFSQVLTEYKKAPEVTRKRLYLEAMESVLSRSSKVLIDAEGNNNLLYLPLDRLTGGSSQPLKLPRLDELPAAVEESTSRQPVNPRDTSRMREVRQ